MPDWVSGHGFNYNAHVGFDEAERSQSQSIQIDFDARTDWRFSGQTDRAQSIVDYAIVDSAIKKLLAERKWRLIEAIAEAVAKMICSDFPVDQVSVKVTKMPQDMPHCAGVSVRCSRTPADYVSS